MCRSPANKENVKHSKKVYFDVVGNVVATPGQNIGTCKKHTMLNFFIFIYIDSNTLFFL